MGASVSICNATNLILNIALQQAFPLFWENRVGPGQCMDRKVTGIFTVYAEEWVGESDSKMDNSIQVLDFVNKPIDLSVTGLSGTSRIIETQQKEDVPRKKGQTDRDYGNAMQNGAKVWFDLNKPRNREDTKLIVEQKYIRMWDGRRISITGGPDKKDVHWYQDSAKEDKTDDFNKVVVQDLVNIKALRIEA